MSIVYQIFIFPKREIKNANKNKEFFFLIWDVTRFDLAPTYFHQR